METNCSHRVSNSIKKLRKELESEEIYHWKITDFKNTNVKTQKYDDFIKTTKKDGFMYLPHRLIVFLSSPLIIDDKNAFLSFDIGNGDFGNYAITHFTVLMRKKNDKWAENG